MTEQSDLCGLTATDYQVAAFSLLPRGWAWPRDPDTVMGKFWLAIGAGLARMHARACAFLRIEVDPSRALELLPDWELTTGLPDQCTGAAETLAERRLAVLSRLTSRGGQNIAFFAALATSLGYEITISEFKPFMAGISRAGDPEWQVGSPTMRFYWSVSVADPRLTWFRAGAGQAGQSPHVSIARADDLECLLNRHRPAHSTLIFNYSGV